MRCSKGPRGNIYLFIQHQFGMKNKTERTISRMIFRKGDVRYYVYIFVVEKLNNCRHAQIFTIFIKLHLVRFRNITWLSCSQCDNRYSHWIFIKFRSYHLIRYKFFRMVSSSCANTTTSYLYYLHYLNNIKFEHAHEW